MASTPPSTGGAATLERTQGSQGSASLDADAARAAAEAAGQATPAEALHALRLSRPAGAGAGSASPGANGAFALTGGAALQSLESGTPDSLRAAAAAHAAAAAAASARAGGLRTEPSFSGAWVPHGSPSRPARSTGSGSFEPVDFCQNALGAGRVLSGSSAGGSPTAGGARRRCPFLIGVAGGTASGKTTVGRGGSGRRFAACHGGPGPAPVFAAARARGNVAGGGGGGGS